MKSVVPFLLLGSLLTAGCIDVGLMITVSDAIAGEKEYDLVFRTLFETEWAITTDPFDPVGSSHFEDAATFEIEPHHFDPVEDSSRELLTMTVTISFVQEDGVAALEQLFQAFGEDLPRRQARIQLTDPGGIERTYLYNATDGNFQGSISLTEILKQGRWTVTVSADGIGLSESKDRGQILIGALTFAEVKD